MQLAKRDIQRENGTVGLSENIETPLEYVSGHVNSAVPEVFVVKRDAVIAQNEQTATTPLGGRYERS